MGFHSYPTSSLIRTRPPPSRRRSISRLSRLYDLPCSGDFAPGRGGLLQLLVVSLSPCYPAEVEVSHRSDFDTPCCLPSLNGPLNGQCGHDRKFINHGRRRQFMLKIAKERPVMVADVSRGDRYEAFGAQKLALKFATPTVERRQETRSRP
jgi:hypothetical protein